MQPCLAAGACHQAVSLAIHPGCRGIPVNSPSGYCSNKYTSGAIQTPSWLGFRLAAMYSLRHHLAGAEQPAVSLEDECARAGSCSPVLAKFAFALARAHRLPAGTGWDSWHCVILSAPNP